MAHLCVAAAQYFRLSSRINFIRLVHSICIFYTAYSLIDDQIYIVCSLFGILFFSALNILLQLPLQIKWPFPQFIAHCVRRILAHIFHKNSQMNSWCFFFVRGIKNKARQFEAVKPVNIERSTLKETQIQRIYTGHISSCIILKWKTIDKHKRTRCKTTKCHDNNHN